MESKAIVGVYGSTREQRTAFCLLFGKKSESQGLEMYHARGTAQTLLHAESYPEKIGHLAAAVTLNSTAFVILPEEGVFGWQEAESCLALAEAGVSSGFFVGKKGLFSSEKIRKMFRGTPLEGYRELQYSNLDELRRVELDQIVRPLLPVSTGQDKLVSIDNAFNVKGVGVVALGFVVSGTLKVHDELYLTESKTSEVKSIQVMDENVEEAPTGSRVGIAFKSFTEKELEKGGYLSGDDRFWLPERARLTKNPFYKGEPNVLLFSVAGQVLTSEVKCAGDGLCAVNMRRKIPASLTRAVAFDPSGKLGSLRVVGTVQFEPRSL
jgi:selenocysteine-specific translation elongation factor